MRRSACGSHRWIARVVCWPLRFECRSCKSVVQVMWTYHVKLHMHTAPSVCLAFCAHEHCNTHVTCFLHACLLALGVWVTCLCMWVALYVLVCALWMRMLLIAHLTCLATCVRCPHGWGPRLACVKAHTCVGHGYPYPNYVLGFLLCRHSLVESLLGSNAQ